MNIKTEVAHNEYNAISAFILTWTCSIWIAAMPSSFATLKQIYFCSKRMSEVVMELSTPPSPGQVRFRKRLMKWRDLLVVWSRDQCSPVSSHRFWSFLLFRISWILTLILYYFFWLTKIKNSNVIRMLSNLFHCISHSQYSWGRLCLCWASADKYNKVAAKYSEYFFKAHQFHEVPNSQART